jgi:hypothetical protein
MTAPLVLIGRTLPGDAFTYARYADREMTHAVQLDPVPVGTPLPALSPADVELLRVDPNKFFKE